jgi:Peptidyl-tRNA hydrolase
MNLSGKAVNYWMQKEKISTENILVITDDLSLPLGKIRLRTKGSDGGHNGLKNIQLILNTTNYSRLRFGIGNDFQKGKQVSHVLGPWKEEEIEVLSSKIEIAVECIKSFCTVGVSMAMTNWNNK